MARKRTIYRDTQTGRFVSRVKYNKSHAQGGKRYKRQVVSRKPRAKKPPIKAPVRRRPPVVTVLIAWLIFFEYNAAKHKGSIEADFIVPGRTDERGSSVEIAARLLSRTVDDLPFRWRWLGNIAMEKMNIDAAKAPEEKPPQKIWIRSFRRGLRTTTWESEEDFYSEGGE